MVNKEAKQFLRRMIDNKGFIARGIYSEDPRYWHSNVRTSCSLMDIVLFNFLCKEGYIRQDRTGRYLVTEKGKEFATPWYKRIFN